MAVGPADEVKSPVGPGAYIIGVTYTEEVAILRRICRANFDAWEKTLKALKRARCQKNALLKVIVDARRQGTLVVSDPDVLCMLQSQGKQ